ncbi:MAG: NAD(P)-dependent alcohol dehydrogenase [bacterium]
MHAIVYHHYGSPSELRPEQVKKPVPAENEVLVKVHAASVNSWDWDLLTGKPYIYRLMFGLLRPKYNIIGSDIAGTVEKADARVTRFTPGDEVFGDISGIGFGAFAEYVCVPESLLARKPAKMDFTEAAALPQAGVLALQGLRWAGGPKAGQKILLNGAGGGVGTLALQLAKHNGARVTCVDSEEKLGMLKELGADHVIDYRKSDFIRRGDKYDLILDVAANRPISCYYRALEKKGKMGVIGGAVSTILQIPLIGPLKNRKGGKKVGLVMHKPNADDLKVLGDLYKEGIIKPVIDQQFPLEETAKAIQLLGEGKAKGKLVITI